MCTVTAVKHINVWLWHYWHVSTSLHLLKGALHDLKVQIPASFHSTSLGLSFLHDNLIWFTQTSWNLFLSVWALTKLQRKKDTHFLWISWILSNSTFTCTYNICVYMHFQGILWLISSCNTYGTGQTWKSFFFLKTLVDNGYICNGFSFC